MDEALTAGWMAGMDKETEKVQRDPGIPLALKCHTFGCSLSPVL